MNRNTLLEMSGRVMHQAMRFTLNAHNDGPMMQEVHLDGMNSDGRNNVERVQNYGFTSSPLPRDQQQGGGDSGGGGGGDGISDIGQMLGQAAEGICMFMGGQRNHPVCIGVDDRRHRPMQMQPGENAQYDDIGQMTLLRRIGTFVLSLDDQQQGGSGGSGKDSSSGASQQQQTRMVSLRHVNKQKQQRPGSQSGSGGGPGGSAGGQSGSQSQYKHEGDSVNHEVRVTKDKVEFYSGATAVGSYQGSTKTWLHASGGDATKSHKVDDNHAHMMYQKNVVWCDKGGCWSSVPIQIRPDPSSTEIIKHPLEIRIEALEAKIAALEARTHGK